MSKIDVLSKAKAALILDQPFFASLLLGMEMREDTSILSNGQPTMATDGESVLYHPDFFTGKTLPEVTFVLAHEVMHNVFEHMHTRGARNANRWNIAADYIINDILVQEKVGKMPTGGLHNPQLVKQGGGTTVGVYDLLPEDTEQQEAGSGNGAGSMDIVRDAGGNSGNGQDNQQGQGPAQSDGKTPEQRRAEGQVRIIQARNAAKMQGKMSAGLERLIAETLRPKVNWKEVLRRFLSQRAKTEYSYARPKRRFAGEDLILPGLTGESLGKLVVAVDCSGSIGEKELAEFSAEIQAINEDTRPAGIHVCYFDDEVSPDTQDFGPDDVVKLSARGGGGTDFAPIFAHVAEQVEQPVAVIVLTDLCCTSYGEAPGCPVLWVSNYRNHEQTFGAVPFGEVTYMERE